jgi:pimeloyl-ACP methyl ester carboxylesterase
VTDRLAPLPLPDGIRSRMVPDINGLAMHVLEAGEPGRPLVVLLHGFPELAFSWRRIMGPLAAAGFHVIAPDQRGYGRTTGADTSYAADLAQYRPLNLVRDIVGLVAAYGAREVAMLAGHDYGAVVAAWASLLRGDIFRSVVLMSAPFGGPPPLPFDTLRHGPPAPPPDIDAALAALDPPRKHYQHHYSTPEANAEMSAGVTGLHDFLRAYYHHKSGDWPGNRPVPLQAWRAAELARLPTYYVMPRALGMAQTVAAEMPTPAQVAACRWLPDDELRVYSGEYARTGFQGGLNWYRCRFAPALQAELELFSGRRIEVPSAFIAGARDWGIHQRPGDLDTMRNQACARMEAVHLLDGAGHWVQQEKSPEVAALLVDFATRHRR